ncbi:MAG: Ig-like domain-containing protein, partial [Anaerolineaceae bacterium]
NPGAEFFAYWAERGVVEGATGWQGLMWQIINGDAPMFELKVEGTSFTLIDGLQGDPNPLRVNGGYYPGLYAFSGVVEDEFGFEDELDVDIFFNDIPFAEDQAVTTPEETAIDITLVATDIEGDELTYAIVTEPAHGTVTVLGNIATYTPALDFVGEDSFTFTANDGTVASNIATVTITVTPVNDAPEAVDDAYDVDEDDVLTVAAPGVMANDIEVDTDGMRVVLVSNVSQGSLILSGDGSFTYTPDPDFTGTDSFVYKLITFPGIQDDWTDEATVTITVNPINDAPVAEDQDVTTAEDTAKEITLVATDIDGDELTYAIVDEPSNGTLTLNGDVATYTPALNFVGEDSFTFTANDGTVDSDMAVVNITVTEVNDAPVAVEDAYTVDEDTVLTVLVADGVLDNDSDVDGDPLTAVLVSDVSNGTLVLDDDGSFVYTPDENYFGSDSFTYKASDGTLESDTVIVTITVNSINDWVIANDDEYETMAGVTLEVAAPGVLTNDVLLDPNETVSLQILTQPAGGTLTLNTDGSFTYVPNAGFFGVD